MLVFVNYQIEYDNPNSDFASVEVTNWKQGYIHFDDRDRSCFAGLSEEKYPTNFLFSSMTTKATKSARNLAFLAGLPYFRNFFVFCFFRDHDSDPYGKLYCIPHNGHGSLIVVDRNSEFDFEGSIFYDTFQGNHNYCVSIFALI